MIRILLNDKNRKLKLFISLLILFALSFYSFDHGKSEKSLKKKVELTKNSINSFPYLRVISLDSDIIELQDKWGSVWITKRDYIKNNLSEGMFLSFKGILADENKIIQINSLIVHNGFRIKLYISILSTILLSIVFGKIFSFNSQGIYRKKF